jgi:CHAD domain-containing protein
VLAAYLLQHGQPKRRSDAWRKWTKPIPQWPQARAGFAADNSRCFPRFLRAAERQVCSRACANVSKTPAKQWKKLDEALHDPAHDRHRLRLLIKRVRYGIEAYPELDRLPSRRWSG